MNDYFLSEAIIDAASALASKLADSYAWHQAIWDAFPGRSNATRDFLFRVDLRGKSYRVLLLSAVKPGATRLFQWRTTVVTAAFLSHAKYRFELKANPTYRRSSDHRRLAIFGEEDLKKWIDRKAAAAGFTIIPATLRLTAPQCADFREGNQRMGRHGFVNFQGVLEVENRELFTQAFFKGIGSAKGFGYGLLMLQPIHD